MTTTLKPKYLCAADDPNWLPLRKAGISASEAAAACGVSSYSQPLQLYLEKRGEIEPIEQNRAMRKGTFMEPFIANEWELETGSKIQERRPGLFSHAEIPWMMATPDAILDKETGLELKDMDPFVAKDALGAQGTDEIPLEWIMQAQQQMEVMGWHVCHFAVMVSTNLLNFTVERNEDLIRKIIARESALWGMIQGGQRPKPLDHSTTLELAREMFKKVKTGSIIELSDQAAADWSGYEARAQTIKTLKAEQEQLKARVLFELGENEAGQLPDGRFVRRLLVKKNGYVVEPTEYIDTRAVSAKVYG